MRKKYLSALLFGALFVASTGTFTSCKDYDDDINNLQTQIDNVKAAVAELQSKVDGGKYVTNIVKEGDGIKITWNDSSSTVIETIKGADGTVVTMGIWSNNGKSVFALKTEAYPLTALLAGMSDVEKAVEQVSDFTLRFASLLGDATSVKANGEFTSNNVTREVILTDANFTLTDALGDTFYLFDGVKSDGNVDKRSDMNLRQGFEEGTEGFETDFTLATAGIKAYYYKNGVKQSIPVTVGAEDTNATLVTNENTKTRAWEPGSISATDVIVTDLPFSHIFVFMTTAIK